MAAYNPYELLRILINRVHFHVETDKTAVLKSVDELEQRNVFGSSVVWFPLVVSRADGGHKR